MAFELRPVDFGRSQAKAGERLRLGTGFSPDAV